MRNDSHSEHAQDIRGDVMSVTNGQSNLAHEDLVSLTQATQLVPKINGRRPAICTLWRWCRMGINDVHLEYCRVGRGIATSREALARFFVALAQADVPLDRGGYRVSRQSRPRTPKARMRSIEDAQRRLERLGM